MIDQVKIAISLFQDDFCELVLNRLFDRVTVCN